MRKIVVAASLAAIAAAAPAAAHGGVSAQSQVRAQVAAAGTPAARDAKRLKPLLVRKARAAVRGYYED